jgi:F0F1-type ATP synthase delta subunit
VTTRTQVAEYVASHLAKDRSDAMRQAAAWLVATGRSRQASYLARDIAAALAGQGYVSARITTARPLTPAVRSTVEAFLRTETGAREIELETIVDTAIIGGARIETPTAELDATVRRQLAKLVEGVHI